MKTLKTVFAIIVCLLTGFPVHVSLAEPVYINDFGKFPAYPYNTAAYVQNSAYVGCGPTAGAMMLGYFEHAYFLEGLLADPVAGVDEGLDTAWTLHGDLYMDTNDAGYTDQYNIKPGTENYAQDRGFTVRAMVHVSPTYDPDDPTWSAYGDYGDGWLNDGAFWMDIGAGNWDIDPGLFCDFAMEKLSAKIPIWLTIDTNGDGGGDHWVPLVGCDEATHQYAFYDTKSTLLQWADITYCDGPSPAANAIAFVRSVEYLGKNAGAEWWMDSDAPQSLFGHAVAAAGDVNGDNYDDVIVGAPYQDGKAFVYHGSANGPSASYDWMDTGTPGGTYLDHFGISVASAGDVNDDGFDDVIIGTEGYGRAFVYHGSADGLSSDPDWTASRLMAGSWFGAAVSTTGDVNGDGYDDVIVGAPYFDTVISGQPDQSGMVYVYYGSADGLSENADWVKFEFGYGSPYYYGHFGWSVATAGDVNDDGYDDVIVGAEGADRAFVYYGSATGLSSVGRLQLSGSGSFGWSVATAGDVNNDGYDDVIVGAPEAGRSGALEKEGKVLLYLGSESGLSVIPARTIWGGQANANLGKSVGSAGYFNCDQYADVIVGGNYLEGRVVVYYGSDSGLQDSAGWTAHGNQNNSGFGWSVSTAGDVNGDRGADVIVGAPLYSFPEENEGAVFAYYGCSTLPVPPSNLEARYIPSQIHVTWRDNSDNESGFRLEYKRTPCVFPCPWMVLADLPPNVTSFQMDGPLLTNSTYFFRVVAYNNEGDSFYSDDDSVFIGYYLPWFSIDVPNGDEVWAPGSLNPISWTNYMLAPDHVTVRYSIDGGSSWIPIATDIPNTGSYSWTVANTPSDQCIVKVEDAVDGLPYDLSNHPFSIALPECRWDFDEDGDVDGSDLAVFDPGATAVEVETFAAEFGRIDCQ